MTAELQAGLAPAPRPSSAGLRLVRPPEVPFDDELPAQRLPAGTPMLPLAPPTRGPGRVRRVEQDHARGWRRVPARVPGSTLTVALEVAAGQRPPSALARLVAPEICEHLARRAYRRSLSRQPMVATRLTSMHICEPASGVAEVCAVAVLGSRVLALAARFEDRPGGWVCTALRIG